MSLGYHGRRTDQNYGYWLKFPGTRGSLLGQLAESETGLDERCPGGPAGYRRSWSEHRNPEAHGIRCILVGSLVGIRESVPPEVVQGTLSWPQLEYLDCASAHTILDWLEYLIQPVHSMWRRNINNGIHDASNPRKFFSLPIHLTDALGLVNGFSLCIL